MPTYDFQCETCKREVSITQRIDQTLTPPICATCAAEMKRKYGSPLAQFKGSGFYSTDKAS